MYKITGSKHKSFLGNFDFIRSRPGMACGGKDIRILTGFFNGVKTCVSKTGKGSNEVFLYNNFLEYITNSYKEKYPNHSLFYHYLILASNNDGEKAFDLFFELWDEFVKENNIVFEWDEVNE